MRLILALGLVRESKVCKAAEMRRKYIHLAQHFLFYVITVMGGGVKTLVNMAKRVFQLVREINLSQK